MCSGLQMYMCVCVNLLHAHVIMQPVRDMVIRFPSVEPLNHCKVSGSIVFVCVNCCTEHRCSRMKLLEGFEMSN